MVFIFKFCRAANYIANNHYSSIDLSQKTTKNINFTKVNSLLWINKLFKNNIN